MDQKLFFLINREWTSPALDLLMATASSFDFWIPVLFVLVTWIGWRGGFRGRAMIVTALIVIGISDGVVVNALKHAVNRPRPTQVESVRVVDLKKTKPRLLAVFQPPKVEASHPETGPINDGRSFPSGHASNNFAIAVVLTVFYSRRGWLYFIPASLIGYSRIYTGAHWPSDVIASSFMGAGISLVCIAVVELCWRRYGSKLAPEWFARYPSLFRSAPSA